MSRRTLLTTALMVTLFGLPSACSSTTDGNKAPSGGGPAASGAAGDGTAGAPSLGGDGQASAGAPVVAGAPSAEGGGSSGSAGAVPGSSGASGASTGGAGSGGASASGAGGQGGNVGSAGSTGPTLGTLACGKPWTNPAKGDTWAHDPSLARDGNTYYLFSTPKPVVAPAVRDLVPFETSSDGITWTKKANVFATPLAWWSADIPAPETWAADVHQVGGTYYVYYSISAWGNFNSSIGLATNTTLDPASPNYHWVDRGKVIDFRNGGAGVNVIDPNLFVDDDGGFWLVYGSYKSGLRLVQLDPKTGKLLKDPPAVTVLTNGLGEGSDILKHGGYYYLMVSTGVCCAGLNSTYHVGVGRSTTLAGPYLTKDNKRMLDGAYTVFLPADADHPGQGGQSFHEENGQLYMVYHAYTRPTGDPVINVRPMFFDQTGWPTLDPCLAAP